MSRGGCQGSGVREELPTWRARSQVRRTAGLSSWVWCTVGLPVYRLSPPGPPLRPKYKGKYCVGERKRVRLCNLQRCPPGRPSFRHVQCSHFDAMLYKGQLHTWVPVVNDGESRGPQGPRSSGQGSEGPRYL